MYISHNVNRNWFLTFQEIRGGKVMTGNDHAVENKEIYEEGNCV